MKKLILIVAMAVMAINSNAQWGSGQWNYTRGIDTIYQILTLYNAQQLYSPLVGTKSDTIKGLGYTGFHVKNSNTGKVVFFGGIGRYNAGEIVLNDSTGYWYWKVKDTLGGWYQNYNRPLSVNQKFGEVYNIDTLKQITFDTTLKVKGLQSGANGVDSLVGYNAGSHALEKMAPITWLTGAQLKANGTGVSTTFTLNIGSGHSYCMAVSQAPAVATVTGCSITGTTVTVTTASAPSVGTNNVLISVVYW